ncbi:MAG: D-alanyl-D-alanine carboxypeptidase [Candidatus Magasanikbacteria bacterium]|nr:D-alanyl-D-alanine carboxypeptidase [Candidatus Magasanikbacteria bacterium]
MSEKITNFLSSFGLMITGVLILFAGTVSGTIVRRPVAPVARLPSVESRSTPTVVATHAPVPAPEGGDIPVVFPVSRPSVPLLKEAVEFGGPLTAAAVVVVDDDTNTVLYQKNVNAVRPLASITKLMSALVLSDLPMRWASTTMVAEDDLIDASSHQVSAGESYTLDNLWQVALIGSSNSAIHALVRMSGLSPEQFVRKMNDKARSLGLASLRFVEPTGLDDQNVGTALDIARLLKAALKVDRIYRTLQTGEYYATPLNKSTKHRVWTTNWLLTNWVPNRFDKDLLVGKTGYIATSGYNFSVRITGARDHAIRVVVLGAASNEARFGEAKSLAEWAFGHYVWPDDAGYALAAP